MEKEHPDDDGINADASGDAVIEASPDPVLTDADTPSLAPEDSVLAAAAADADDATAPADATAPDAATADARHPRGRRVWVAWFVAVGAIVLVAAVAAWIHVSANRSFDAAAADMSAASAEVEEVRAALDGPTDDATDAVEASLLIVGAAADDMVDAGARTGLSDAAAAVSTVMATIGDHHAVEVPAVPTKPFWTWELLETAPRMNEAAAQLAELSADTRSAGDELVDAGAALADAARALYASVPAAAAALEAANVSGRSIVVLDFREAAAAAAQQTRLGSGAVDAFEDYARKLEILRASSQSELAEKAGPLLGTRLEIEAFARSIAGGVVLDFDWAPIVNGVGGADGMAGTATWAVVRGGFSTITLSNSVAENRPSADARALVAHEVGHAITSKCSEMFDSEDRTANEQWATAWAIGMGFSAQGSGVQAYGYPPTTLIETSRSCR